MEIKVVRLVLNGKSTLGKMYVNNTFFAYTCEDTVRELGADCKGKVLHETAISYGRYEVILSFSNRFQKYLPLLLNVPCFEGIRIHGGNTAADSEGCILVGGEGDLKTKIWNCATKVNALVALLKSVERKEKSWISIEKIIVASTREWVAPKKEKAIRKPASVTALPSNKKRKLRHV